MVSDVQAPLKTSGAQLNVNSGGSALGVAAFAVLGTSIASSRVLQASPTGTDGVADGVLGGSVWSNRSVRSSLRGVPEVNFIFGADLPLTLGGSQAFVLAIEYSVGLK